MPKVKEPTPQYSATRQTLTAEILLSEIQTLPNETILEIINYVQRRYGKDLHHKMDKKKLSSYVGKMKLRIAPLRYQKTIRDEWK